MKKHGFIVGIGASAGGLDAIQQLFQHLPDDTGMSFVIVQHLAPNFKSLMPELLSKHTQMQIYTSEHEQEIRPNCIYLNQRNKDLVLNDQKLILKDRDPKKQLNLPIDLFFHSLATEFQDSAVAIILSGTGSDGSRGIRSIKENGGTIFVQDPESAQFDGMPNTAIATNLAEFILPPEKIAEELIKISSKKTLIPDFTNPDPVNSETTFLHILQEILKSSGIDFREYKHNTLVRRLEKRMTIKNILSLDRYLDLLRKDPFEKEMLRKDFLISVTSFFRDIDAFQILNKQAIRKLVDERENNEVIRVWVAGCATGEEAYSIAILLDEMIEKSKKRLDFKIFATDLDIDALKIAGYGTYPVNIATDISDSRLEKYFVKTGSNFQIIKKIREKIVFSYHNLLKDPPFVRMDLITCRNLLIYLENRIQKKIMLNFQFALKNDGFLFLGSSESLGDLQKYFAVIDSKWKIYQNITDQKVLPSYIMPEEKLQLYDYKNTIPIRNFQMKQETDPSDGFYFKRLAELHAPSCLVVDSNNNLVFMLGNAKEYLQFQDGVFDNKLFNLAPKELLPAFRTGIKKLKKDGGPVEIQNVRVRYEDKEFETTLLFRSLIHPKGNSQYFIVEFGDKTEAKPIKTNRFEMNEFDNSSRHRIEELETELRQARNELQNVVEELETSNEELQSSNEELLASNEELQSTNEELQSVNEELYTVNTELQEKNKELLNLNSDMNNLLNSTDIGTLFLDRHLNIRKFTPALKKHFNLREDDIGRPINAFTSSFNEKITQQILAESKKVLQKKKVFQDEIIDHDGHCYLIRIHPFISHEKSVNGVVITLTDINDLKQTETELSYQKNLLTNVVKYLPGALVFLYDRKMNLLMADGEELYELGFSPDIIKGKNLREITTLKEYKKFVKHFESAFEKKGKVSFETRMGRQDYIINAIPINSVAPGKNTLLVLAINATDINQTRAELQKLNQAVFQAPSPIMITDLKGKINYVNPKFESLTGFSSDEITGKPARILGTGNQPTKFYNTLWDTILKGKTWRGEFYNIKKNGTRFWELASISPLRNSKGRITGFVKVSEDVSEIKRFEKELKKAKEKAEIANIYKNNFLANMSHEIRTPMNGIIGFSNLLKEPGLTAKDKEDYVQIIHNNSLQLLNLIDDIIDISKIEAGELKVTKGECHINQILFELKVLFEHELGKTNKKELELDLQIPDGKEDLVIRSDSIRIKQILSNLLSNALKFTKKGKISFGYDFHENDMIFFVQDSGIGIPPDKLKRIFKRFEQSGAAISKKYGGTGLGLSISKGLIKLLDGEIWVESKEGKGSTFRFSLPYEEMVVDRSLVKKRTSESFQNIQDKNVLVVEDDDIVWEFLKIVLKTVNVKMKRSINGQDAIKMFQNGNAFDLVLMDIGLPDIDGYEVTRQILKLKPEIKIIAQTAYAMQDDIERCYKAGCHDYISKPISPELLVSKMKNVLD